MVTSYRRRRHGYDRPPERVRDAAELRGFRVLGEVDGAREEDDTDEQEEDQQTEFAHARFDRLAEDLQTLGMAR